MREILFKAKRIDNGEWVEGFLIKDLHEEEWYIGYLFGGGAHDTDVVQIDPSTLCQYTGLTDRNGREIWENDIIEEDWTWFKGIIRFGEFENGVLKNIGFNIEWNKETFYRQDLPHWAERLEVVGNIFDNLELLEGGTE